MAAAQRRVATFRIDEDILEGMEFLRDRDGTPFSEQIRRGLRLWLESRGVAIKKADGKRASTRKRS
jgi:hypothetical protein